MEASRPTPVIHVVDDDESFLTATSRLLRAAGYEVRSYANAGDFLLSRVDTAPGCILLDIYMPGPSGLDLQRALAKESDPLPIIFLSGRGDVPTAVRAIKSGAVDVLTKPVASETLLGVIENALARAAAQRVGVEELKSLRARHATLTDRERAVFKSVVAGRMNKEIGKELGAAVRTIKVHRARVMQKMGASTLAELVRIAERLRTN